jgi:hypothetical protein
MGGPVDNIKANDTANSAALGYKRDFELDSKFDFLYSKPFKHSRLSGQFNANQMLMSNTII